VRASRSSNPVPKNTSVCYLVQIFIPSNPKRDENNSGIFKQNISKEKD